MKDLVTVKMSDFEADLAIAKSYLMDNGVDCVINSEYLSVSTNEGGSVRLQVRAEDFVQASELLIDGGFSTQEDFEE